MRTRSIESHLVVLVEGVATTIEINLPDATAAAAARTAARGGVFQHADQRLIAHLVHATGLRGAKDALLQRASLLGLHDGYSAHCDGAGRASERRVRSVLGRSFRAHARSARTKTLASVSRWIRTSLARRGLQNARQRRASSLFVFALSFPRELLFLRVHDAVLRNVQLRAPRRSTRRVVIVVILVSLASPRVASPRASTSTFIGLKSQLDAIVAARASLARAARRSPSNAHRLPLHVHVVARASPSTARARAKTKRRRALPPHIHERAPSCRERGASRDAFDREATTLALSSSSSRPRARRVAARASTGRGTMGERFHDECARARRRALCRERRPTDDDARAERMMTRRCHSFAFRRARWFAGRSATAMPSRASPRETRGTSSAEGVCD